MKKLITMLSALTVTSTLSSTIIACSKEQNELDLNSLNADSFKELNTIDKGIGIKTQNINEIKDDKELIKAIKDHIQIMTLKNLFGLKGFIQLSEKDRKVYAVHYVFWHQTTPLILNIDVKVVEPNKQYEITIKKEKWENIKIDPIADKVASESVKSYYDLIKGEEVKITINK